MRYKRRMKQIILTLVLFVSSQAALAADFNPFEVDATQQIDQMDRQYFEETGLNPIIINQDGPEAETLAPRCRRETCAVYIHVSRLKQRMQVYLNGVLQGEFATSTGKAGFETPNFDTNPNGRVYQIYSSSKYPGYDNMPYAVFIQGGFAIHGAPGDEERNLGHMASHGCVRLQVANAQFVNKLVSQSIADSGGSTRNIWITVEN